MKTRHMNFWTDDRGEIVIWVVLVAAFVLISGAAFWVFAPGYKTVTNDNLDLLCSVAQSSDDAMADQDERVDCNRDFSGLPD